ncbi:putative Rhoptry kinase family protein, truncated (incomplete catalytic triad) [Neospora caninum Liverpool]|uniref:Putative Rhoptry kinase family protein, truncated (Incomplete catalytic triad) n=1 Tax=Neospora caninum (strain Liverpool) TaxID=572307 RepID=F0V978_NEOCL|nr:putative Rhoptry kinase family protein, truncated (incomplete catalytic triad) [Neospora caninum Liverpool]CBZ50303.1 putative Rhoptry kinase family protein, truncated (incomplete catalytic triad) [Neospora caninum Liverpool]CEL64908.1 TPA: Rhoptry kinase family protein, truncated (incomplete catalytic triad), putative [Neospora caninum Liverpool]|eukprot:XP_003880337.1 putative Rhoptry kinase family protein, truncated (incomplete catalytic triad) [Neospora caninum Liverpool]
MASTVAQHRQHLASLLLFQWLAIILAVARGLDPVCGEALGHEGLPLRRTDTGSHSSGKSKGSTHHVPLSEMTFWSWMSYLKDLPDIDESRSPVLKRLLSGSILRRDGSTSVNIRVPAKELVRLLSLSEEQEKEGVSVKVRLINLLDPKYSVYEAYLYREVLPKKSPLLLPSLGEFRGPFLTYIFHPLTKGLVGDMLETGRSLPDLQLLAANMVAGLHSLHKLGLLHRSIELNSFCILSDGKVVLGELQTAAPIGTESRVWAGLLGRETAPEIDRNFLADFALTQSRHTVKSDVYSLGVAFRNLLQLVGNGSMGPDDGGIVRRDHVERLDRLSQKMIDEEPANRPNLEQIMKDPLFEGLSFQEIEEGIVRPFRHRQERL